MRSGHAARSKRRHPSREQALPRRQTQLFAGMPRSGSDVPQAALARIMVDFGRLCNINVDTCGRKWKNDGETWQLPIKICTERWLSIGCESQCINDLGGICRRWQLPLILWSS